MSTDYLVTDIIDRNAFDPHKQDSVAFRMHDECMTYSELQTEYQRIAAHLQAREIRKGDLVALYLGNSLEWVQLFFALAHIGAVTVPLNILWTGKEVNDILSENNISVLITDEGSLSKIEPEVGSLNTLIVLGAKPPKLPNVKTVVSFAEFRQEPPPLEPVTVRPTDLAMMYFTSGTTGSPKAAQHTHNGILWNTLHQISDLELREDDRFLVVPSLSWGAGLHCITLAIAWLGAENTLLASSGGNTLDRIVSEIEKNKITRALLVPTLLKELLRRPELLERLRRTPFRRANSGAEPLYAETVIALQQQLPDVAITQTYGMSEFPMIATITTPSASLERPGTAGRPSSITSLGVLNDEGIPAPRGTGEVVMKSPALTVGFLNAPEKNSTSFRNGWFHTGDLGRIDDDGYLTIVGRAKDMIISGGLNVYPREIESVLNQIPDVIECAVIGRKDEKWGEVPIAVLVVEPNSSLTREDVLDFCRKHLSGFKCPKDALIRAEPLPKTVTGKIVKRRIVDTANPVPSS